MDIDLATEPLGIGAKGPVFLRDNLAILARRRRRSDPAQSSAGCFTSSTGTCFEGTTGGAGFDVPTGDRYAWAADSTYVKNPPYFEGMTRTPPGIIAVAGARVLAMLGDSITTDHISPAGNIPVKSPAGGSG